MEQRTRVLVTGTEHTGGLAALRALRVAGLDPWAAVSQPESYGARSRAAGGVVRVPGPRADPDGFAAALAALVPELGARAVIPGTDAALLALAERREQLPHEVAVGVPETSIVLSALDKQALPALVAGTAVRVPPTVRTRAGRTRAATAETGLPALVKPLRSELRDAKGRLGRYEARLVAEPSELEEALKAFPREEGLVQRLVPGRLVSVGGVAWNGRVVASVHKAAERTWPPGCGIVCYARTTEPDPATEQAIATLVHRLGWSGMFNIQLIEAPGGPWLIDLNPRLYHSLGLAVAAGANLPAVWAALMVGRPAPATRYRRGMRFRSEEDLRAVLWLARERRVGAALRALVPRRRTVHAILDRRDLGPSIALLKHARS